MSNINPYDAPAAASDVGHSASRDFFGFANWDARSARLWGKALRVSGLGFTTTLVGLGLLMSGYSRVGGESVTALGLLVVLFGNAMLATVKGKQKTPLLFAILLQVVAMVCALAYARASINGQIPNGFLKLFGASVFAGLLFSQTIIAIVLRAWSLVQQLRVATHACEVVIGTFAVSAAICSLMSLEIIPVDSHKRLAKIILFLALTGLCGLLVATASAELQSRYRRRVDDSVRVESP